MESELKFFINGKFHGVSNRINYGILDNRDGHYSFSKRKQCQMAERTGPNTEPLGVLTLAGNQV